MQKGCACKFLYGQDTKDEHKAQIDKALESKNELKLEVIFYKKTGEYFTLFLFTYNLNRVAVVHFFLQKVP